MVRGVINRAVSLKNTKIYIQHFFIYSSYIFSADENYCYVVNHTVDTTVSEEYSASIFRDVW